MHIVPRSVSPFVLRILKHCNGILNEVNERSITYQSSLSSTLDTIQPEEEWRRPFTFALIVFSVLFQSLENKWNAVLGLVIDDLRHNEAHVLQRVTGANTDM
jgi:hypothetical protein